MLGTLIVCLFNASIFSINGMGEDLSVFRTPFIENTSIGQIRFTLDPEYTLLNQDGDFRGVFWTNPLKLSISVPVVSGFSIMAGNIERLSQSYDIFLQDSSLQIHALGEGGIEEVYAGLNKRLGPIDIAASGSYLFGNAWEIWNYSITGYTMVDTFLYRYQGRIFNIGLKHDLLFLAYEGLGRLRMVELEEDTTMFDLAERLSIGFTPKLGKWELGLVYERSFWDEEMYDSPNRLKISARRGSVGFAYFYNPWYVRDVTEHGIDFDVGIPLRRVGSAHIRLTCALREREGLREFKFVPSVRFVLNELFARRRK